MKLLFFTKYTEIGPSSRYRVYQYLPYFKKFECDVYPFFNEKYVLAQSFKSIAGFFYVLGCYLRRAFHMFRIKKGDLIFLQYEFMPYVPFNILFFKIFKIHYIVDFDDAIFHTYDTHSNKLVRYFLKNKIAHVIKNAKTVITGSPYLTAYAKKYHTNVIEIPTSIDLEKYKILKRSTSSNTLVIGWIGSSTTSLHLRLVVDALKILQQEQVNFELHLIGYNKNEGIHFNGLPIKYIDWNNDIEVEELNKIDVGIMPLINFPFAKGKCAFKLIQYMAVAKPTISSPFEAHLKLDKNNENLFAETTKQWVECFKKINHQKDFYINVGLRNRKLIEKEYSIQSNSKKYIEIFKVLKV